MSRSVTTSIAVAAALAGAGLFVAVQPLGIGTAKAQDLPDCPDKIGGNSALTCYCSSEATATGTVWGSNVYTDDSKVCRAALHAGVIGTDGGVVNVRSAAGRPAYSGTVRNSVASSNWGRWGRSFVFMGAGASVAPVINPGVAACPANVAGLPVGRSITCACPSGLASGSVWGSGPYTADSIVCRAAAHAGAIGYRGGVVRLTLIPGQNAYGGSARNGVTTSNWGRYEKSYVFGR